MDDAAICLLERLLNSVRNDTILFKDYTYQDFNKQKGRHPTESGNGLLIISKDSFLLIHPPQLSPACHLAAWHHQLSRKFYQRFLKFRFQLVSAFS